jgi:hypothetical protein
MKQQNKMPYGYKWFTGRVMSDSMTDAYNRLTDSIERALADGMNSLADDLKKRRFNLGAGVVYNFDNKLEL